jgi:hypothetical protein
LFISDAAGFISSSRQIFPCFFTGYQQYIDSLEYLRSKNANFLATAHGGFFYGPEAINAFLDWAITEALDMQKKIITQLGAGVETEQMIENIMPDYYHDDLTIYSPKNIKICIDALIKRVQLECIS